MTDKIGEMRISKIIERDDGGSDIEYVLDEEVAVRMAKLGLEITFYCAGYKVGTQDVDEEVAVRMAKLGLEITFYCAAYKVGTQDVLDWISSHKKE